MNVATGKVEGICGETRTEEDFARAMDTLLKGNPGYTKYHFVMDQLNTHKSETLVRWVADYCGIEEDLGEKGKSGILKSMQSR